MTEPASITILVVDDDEGHCELIARNLRRSGITNEIRSIHNGGDALRYLNDVVGPDGENAGELLMLLDINMPGGSSGIDVLREIKGNPRTHLVPVIMLTTTDDPREINQCYDLGCSVYITKPVDSPSFNDALTRLGLLIAVVSFPIRTPVIPRV